jgi:hypothetical protein
MLAAHDDIAVWRDRKVERTELRIIDFPIDALLATSFVPAIQVALLSALGLFQTGMEKAAQRHR